MFLLLNVLQKIIKSNHLLSRLGWLSILFIPLSLSAIEVTDLYQASVSISNQSRQARTTGQRDVFRKVLIKVSGNSQVLKNPEVKTAIRRASRYLNQFQFTRNSDNELQFEASFDEGKVNRLLRQEALPIWGKRRPSILLWMAGEEAQTLNRQVISKEAYPHLLKQINQLSKDRGLPIIFPLYDLQDTKVVSVSDIWGYFFDHIEQFSSRYNTDAIVISRFWHEPPSTELLTLDGQPIEPLAAPLTTAVETDKNWHLQWRLFEKGELVDNKTITGELDDLMNTLVNTMADDYAAEYAVDSKNLNDATRIVLTVRNVSQIANLINAEKLLGSFSSVADVLLKSINNDVAEFEVVLIGELLDLLQGLDLEERFEKIYDPFAVNNIDTTTDANKAGETDIEPMLEFRWNP